MVIGNAWSKYSTLFQAKTVISRAVEEKEFDIALEVFVDYVNDPGLQAN